MNRRRVLLIAAATVAVLAIAGGVFLFANRTPVSPRGTVAAPAATAAETASAADSTLDVSENRPTPSGVSTENGRTAVDVGELLPATSTFAAFLPVATDGAWDLVSRLADSRSRIATFDDFPLSTAATYVTSVGYANLSNSGDAYTAPGTPDGSVDAVYLVTSGDAEALEVSSWFSNRGGAAGTFIVDTYGPVVVLTVPWANPALFFDGPRLNTLGTYTDGLDSLDTPDSVLYLDPRRYLLARTTILGEATDAYTSYIDAALGLGSGNVAWVGSVDGDAYTWDGSVLGDELSSVNATDASNIQGDTLLPPEIESSPNEDGQFESQVSPEATKAVSAMAALPPIVADSDGDASFTLDPAALDSALLSLPGTPNIESWEVSIDAEGNLRISFVPTTITYGSDATFSPLPSVAPIDPNAPAPTNAPGYTGPGSTGG